MKESIPNFAWLQIGRQLNRSCRFEVDENIRYTENRLRLCRTDEFESYNMNFSSPSVQQISTHSHHYKTWNKWMFFIDKFDFCVII